MKFLDSTFRESLKNALEKYGLNKTFLDNFKQNLMNEREKRRNKEREVFFIEKNNCDEENVFNIDLFQFIFNELVDEDL